MGVAHAADRSPLFLYLAAHKTPDLLAASSGVEDTLLRSSQSNVGLIVVLATLGDSGFGPSRTGSATIDDDSAPVPRDAGLHIEYRASLRVDHFS
jgi:hypothetical protein